MCLSEKGKQSHGLWSQLLSCSPPVPQHLTDLTRTPASAPVVPVTGRVPATRVIPVGPQSPKLVGGRCSRVISAETDGPSGKGEDSQSGHMASGRPEHQVSPASPQAPSAQSVADGSAGQDVNYCTRYQWTLPHMWPVFSCEEEIFPLVSLCIV